MQKIEHLVNFLVFLWVIFATIGKIQLFNCNIKVNAQKLFKQPKISKNCAMLGVGHSHLQTFRLSFKELQRNLGFFFALNWG